MEFILNETLASDSIIVGQFDVSELLLMNDRQFPWFTLVPRRAGVTEIYQLGESDQHAVWHESAALAKVIMNYFNGHKLNVAAIGNVVSQLHIHHVVRFKHDGCWPKPIWGQQPMLKYDPWEAQNLASKIARLLEDKGFQAKNA
jgi:diadenosine tetraphosphate (Ap4A) HIT family hydrolase